MRNDNRTDLQLLCTYTMKSMLVCISGILILLQSCTLLPEIKGYYTPEEAYRNAAALVDRVITVRGKVDIVAGMCTEEACPPDNPCCNSCQYGLGFILDAFHSLYFSGEAAACGGDDCHVECDFLDPGGSYEITGRMWKDLGDLVYLEVLEWKRIT
jgi:hypothetical protein